MSLAAHGSLVGNTLSPKSTFEFCKMPNSRLRIVFWCLFAVQVVCSLAIVRDGLPVYRELLQRKRDQATSWEIAVAIMAVVIMQVAYWVAYPLQAGLKLRRHVLLGHVSLTMGELTFLFPATMTVVAVFDESIDFQLEWWRLLILIAALFAMYCLKCQFESLGRALIDGPAHG